MKVCKSAFLKCLVDRTLDSIYYLPEQKYLLFCVFVQSILPGAGKIWAKVSFQIKKRVFLISRKSNKGLLEAKVLRKKNIPFTFFPNCEWTHTWQSTNRDDLENLYRLNNSYKIKLTSKSVWLSFMLLCHRGIKGEQCTWMILLVIILPNHTFFVLLNHSVSCVYYWHQHWHFIQSNIWHVICLENPIESVGDQSELRKFSKITR